MFRSATSTLCPLLLLFADFSYACTRVSYTSGEEDGSRVVIGRKPWTGICPLSHLCMPFPPGYSETVAQERTL
jgi:hypothetical protein